MKRRMPKRLEQFMEKAVAANLATEEALTSAINLVDPFPDDSIDNVGWPTTSSSYTVPQIRTEYVSVSAPGSTVNTWNMKVLFLPISNVWQMTGMGDWNRNTGLVTNTTSVGVTFGQFNVWTWDSAAPEPSYLSAPTYSVTMDADASWSKNRMTLAGFEAINTSSDLYRGGMYYGYRVPRYPYNAVQLGSVAAPTPLMFARTEFLGGFPSGLDDVTNLSTTISGKARDGVGVFSLPRSFENEYTAPSATLIGIVNEISTSTAPLARFRAEGQLTSVYDWDLCGAYITGLAKEATFQLKCRVGYETQVTSASSKLIQAVSTKPVPRSLLIEEMLSQLLTHTPAGFDYSENPLGEWMAKILNGLASVVPILGNFIPHPLAKPIAMAAAPFLSTVAGAIDGHQQAKKQKRELAKRQVIPRP